MVQYNNIDIWKNRLGLLPITLFSSIKQKKFILLNGGYGDFCIDFEPDKKPEDYYSYAWSSNTKNFVTLKDEKIVLYNWLKGEQESYKLDLVSQKIEKFYDYLLQKSYKSEYDIVPFIINIYKSLRNQTNEKAEGVQALNHLFLLLAAFEDGIDIKKVDLKKWNISNVESTESFDRYVEEFKNGIQSNPNNLKPNVELILRHSAGQLFQEAQKEAVFFNRGMDLFGLYDSKYTSNQKISNSFHYTPSFLARSIVEYSLSKLNLYEYPTLKILDPACGSSEFLLEVLKQLKSLGFNGNVEINGWDSSKSAINTSKFLLTYEKREWQDKLSLNIELVKNSLTKKWDNDYDIILMNPPFLSWELMEPEDREIILDVLGKSTKQKPNLASAFVSKSIKHLKPKGILGTVMPTSILLMDSYKNLRNEIKDTLSLLLVGKLGNFVFEHALTDVSILIGKKPQSSNIPLLLWTKNEKGIVNEAFRELRKINYKQISYVKDNKSYNIYEPDKYPINKENWKILSFNEQELIKHLTSLILLNRLKTIQDIFNVKQGIRTGNNKIFKISQEFYNSKLPAEERKYFRPAIDNDSIKKGCLKVNNYIWYPYNQKGIIFKNEEELKIKAPFFYDYLYNHNEILKKRKGISFWWTLTRPRNWQYENKLKLTSTEFGKAGSFALDNKGEFVIERGNGWVPKKEFNNDDYYFYLSIFNSPFFDKLLSIYSKDLLMGWDLGKKYTKNIPIPEITDELRNSLVFKKLIDFGKLISKEEFFNYENIDDYLKEYIYKIDLNI